MKDESSDARKAIVAATSSGRPSLFIAACRGISACTSAVKFSSMGVSMTPGLTTFARIPRGAANFAKDFVKQITPALDAA
jgi:hypothetical protein